MTIFEVQNHDGAKAVVLAGTWVRALEMLGWSPSLAVVTKLGVVTGDVARDQDHERIVVQTGPRTLVKTN